jgi:pimeloyl-ACP methyl ester carboxylesterase
MPQVASRDGLRIHYESRGQGVPVVLLHPNHATSRTWIELGWFDALQSVSCQPVSLDARGFGQSDSVTDPARLAPGTSTEDIAAVMDALGIEAAHLCGFSMGAATAVRFAADQPARVESLVLGGLSLGPLLQVGLYLGNTPGEARKQALRQVDRVLRELSGNARSYFSAVRALIATAPLRPLVGADLRAPILGVSGERDPFDPQSLYEDLRTGGAPIEIKQVPGAGHGSCFVHPSFRQAAAAFVARNRRNNRRDR